MEYRELEKIVQAQEKTINELKQKINVPSQEAGIAKELRDLKQTAQQRSHTQHTSDPSDTDGVDGEIRVVHNSLGAIYLVTKDKGKWVGV